MKFQNSNFEPAHKIRIFKIRYGGMSKKALFKKLKDASVMFNEYAGTLFSSNLFRTSPKIQNALVVELSVNALGFSKDANVTDILERAKDFGLSECPLEIGPYFRLQYLDQLEQFESEKNKPPLGSVTVISKPLLESDDFPKGFYLRRIDGKLCLRGYAGPMNITWNPEDRIALMI